MAEKTSKTGVEQMLFSVAESLKYIEEIGGLKGAYASKFVRFLRQKGYVIVLAGEV